MEENTYFTDPNKADTDGDGRLTLKEANAYRRDQMSSRRS